MSSIPVTAMVGAAARAINLTVNPETFDDTNIINNSKTSKGLKICSMVFNNTNPINNGYVTLYSSHHSNYGVYYDACDALTLAQLKRIFWLNEFDSIYGYKPTDEIHIKTAVNTWVAYDNDIHTVYLYDDNLMLINGSTNSYTM
jgi:hypothetical protein